MPTEVRTVIPGICCHVTQRGNYRQPKFFCDEDREPNLDLLARRAVELQLLGWCLMSNHMYRIVCPQYPEALARTFRPAHSEYSQYVNRKHQRASDHLWRALRYVELNPFRAQLAKDLPSITGHREGSHRLGASADLDGNGAMESSVYNRGVDNDVASWGNRRVAETAESDATRQGMG